MAAPFVKLGLEIGEFFAIRDRVLVDVQLFARDLENAKLFRAVQRNLAKAVELSTRLNRVEDQTPEQFHLACLFYLAGVRGLYEPTDADMKTVRELFSKTTALISQIETYMRRHSALTNPSPVKPVSRVKRVEDLKTWGDHMRLTFGRYVIPNLTYEGRPTQYALQAVSWGQKRPPATGRDVGVLYARALEALELYRELKRQGFKPSDPAIFKIEVL